MELAVGLLGPLDIRQDGEAVAAPVGNRRRILALMLLDGGTVSRTRLAAELWGRDAPRSAPANLRTYLSGLRAWLADRADLVREGAGWRLVPPSRVRLTVDVTSFQAELAQGRRAARCGDLVAAGGHLRHALGYWRGAPLQDVPQGGPLGARAAVLEAERFAATEEYASVLVKLGEYEAARAMLHEFLGDHPHRERAWGQLMVACYRSGDLAGALAAYRSARVALITGYGMEPGAELAALHRAILQRRLPVGANRAAGYASDDPPNRHPSRQVVRRRAAAGSRNPGPG
ncbi:AfsR/SARP family transcriptional regulator [Plantactinospora sp. B6F1]|uniref:BTAD domain-containing putative transcriptional regulator n=1 Tax=Plantactinospora sp. B6F1 TaxID=3158971 RepID=UPI00102B0D8E